MAAPVPITSVRFVDLNTDAPLLTVTDPEKLNRLINQSELVDILYTEEPTKPVVDIHIDSTALHAKILLTYFAGTPIQKYTDENTGEVKYDLTPNQAKPTVIDIEDMSRAFEYLQIHPRGINSMMVGWVATALDEPDYSGVNFNTWAMNASRARSEWLNEYEPIWEGGYSRPIQRMIDEIPNIEEEIERLELKAAIERGKLSMNKAQRPPRPPRPPRTSKRRLTFRGRYNSNNDNNNRNNSAEEYYYRVGRIEYDIQNLKDRLKTLYRYRDRELNNTPYNTYPFPNETRSMSNTEFDQWLRATYRLPPANPLPNYLQPNYRNSYGLRSLFGNMDGGRRQTRARRNSRAHSKTRARRS